MVLAGREADGELVSAQAADHIGVTHAFAQNDGHAAKDSVALVVSVHVVDLLEAVEIEVHVFVHFLTQIGEQLAQALVRIGPDLGKNGAGLVIGLFEMVIVEAGNLFGFFPGQMAGMAAASSAVRASGPIWSRLDP